jgi:hypothetical protein
LTIRVIDINSSATANYGINSSATANYDYSMAFFQNDALHAISWVKCTFACQIAWYTILYTQYDVMHLHCLNMQRNQGHVSGIEACTWNTFYQPVSNVALERFFSLFQTSCAERIRNNR